MPLSVLMPRDGRPAPGGRAECRSGTPESRRSSCHMRSNRIQAPLATLEHAQLAHAHAVQQLERPVVIGTDVLRPVGIAREGHRRTRFEAHLEERESRVDLLRALAQPGRGHLDRDARLDDAVDRKLVVATQVSFGKRLVATPNLPQVWVGEDGDKAAARRLTEGAEVLTPDLLRRAP